MELRPMRSWIHHSRGKVLRQAGTTRDGLGLHEDMMTRQGFEGRDAHLYRRNEPILWKRAEEGGELLDFDGTAVEPGDLTDAGGFPQRIAYNADVTVSVSRRSANMTYSVRNADGDELYFVHEGTGTFYTEFGPIPYEPGDYVLLPKGTTYRVRPAGPVNYFLIFESADELSLADIGPLGRRAPFDPALLYVPTPALDELGDGRNEEGEWPVRIKSLGSYTSVYYDFDPIDVEGWKGDLFPFKMNIRDYRPIMSDRLHVMPSAYTVFMTKGFLLGNLLPRPFEAAADAELIPPYHRNMEYDEFTFHHAGTAMQVEVAPASVSLVRRGRHHGFLAELQKKLRANVKPGDRIDMQIIFLDVANPLTVAPELQAAQRRGEHYSEGTVAEEGE